MEHKQNILVFGAGNRVKSTVLPALFALRETFSLMGVISRTPHNLSEWYGGESLESTNDLSQCDLSQVNVIFISVTIEQVATVLKQLSVHKLSHITLVLETPVIHPSHLSSLKIAKRFKKVVVAEDFLALRPYVEAKKIIDSGNIGKLKGLRFDLSGVLHHTGALVRFLSSSGSFRYMRRTRAGKNINTNMRLSSGPVVTLLEPRDYDKGSFKFSGTKGTVGSEPENDFYIEIEKTASNGYSDLKINDKRVAPSAEETLFKIALPNYSLRGVTISEPLWMNELKIYSLMHILSSLEKWSYGPIDGLYDWLPSFFLGKIGFFVDVPFGKHNSLFKSVLKLLST